MNVSQGSTTAVTHFIIQSLSSLELLILLNQVFLQPKEINNNHQILHQTTTTVLWKPV